MARDIVFVSIGPACAGTTGLCSNPLSTSRLKRLAGAIPTVLLLSIVVFFVLRALPADPLALLLPPNATKADAEVVRHALGLDRSIVVSISDLVARCARPAISAPRSPSANR